MAIVIKPITVEVSKPNVFQAIAAKQNDSNSRFLKVTFANEGEKIYVIPSARVTINAERKDGQSNSFFGEVNDDGTVTVPVHSWILELPGYVNCDVSIIEEDSKLTSTTFTLLVEEASHGSDDISTDEQKDVLGELINEVKEMQSGGVFGNAIANTANGTTIAITDISPIEHTLGVKAITGNRYTVTSSDEQYVAITDAELFVQKTKEAGVNYNLGEEVVFELVLSTSDVPYPLYYNGNKILDVDRDCGLDFPDLTHATFEITVLSVYIKRLYKNLIPPTNYYGNTVTINGITYTRNDDGSITANGLATATSVYDLWKDFSLPKGNYVLSGCPKGGSLSSYALIAQNASGTLGDIGDGKQISLTETTPFTRIRIRFENGYKAENMTFYPMLEPGTMKTDFEPYREPITYPVNENGTVEGVTSLYPTTTLTSNTEGVVLEVNYNVDTKKYIDNKFAELAALIVNS